MKFISWNVNGIRACLNKGFLDFFKAIQADAFCLQEIKLSEGQLDLELPGYFQLYNYAEKKGYSGTAIYTRHLPEKVSYGLGIPEHDHEGRVITLEYNNYYLMTIYTPNSQSELARLEYRMKWEDSFRAYIQRLDQHKPVIFCGDLNVAHQEIDLSHPDSNRRSPGFTDEERNKYTTLLNEGFIDTFRHFFPTKTEAYTWWSYRTRARTRNIGWRIDYFCVSNRLKNQLHYAGIHHDITGSDHCPVQLDINLS